MTSLRTQLLLFLFLPASLFLGLTGWAVFAGVGETLRSQMREEVELIARSLERPLAYSLERDRSGSVKDALETAFLFDRVYGAFLYDTSGTLLAKAGRGESDERTNRYARILDRGETAGRYDVLAGEAVFSFFVPLVSEDGERIGLLQVVRNQDEMDERMTAIQWRFLRGYLLFSVLFFAVLCVYGLLVSRPIFRLRDTMRRIQGGRRHERAAETGPAELRELASALNGMLDALESQRIEIGKREEEEKELRRRLSSSEKLAVLGEMAASIGHEIGTPLATMDGIAQRALRAGGDDSALEYFRNIRSEVRRMEAFVRHLLSLGGSGANPGALADFSRELANAASDAFAAHSGKIVLPEPGRPAEPALVKGDALRLRITLRNLFENSLQIRPDTTVVVGLEREADELVCRIDDDGPGIPPGERRRLFEPFVSGRAHGTGLGLALADRIIRQMGGTIEIGDSPQGGARFTIRLPLSRKNHE
ncbi:MAG: ATP-binding protein [Puniceicoccaceae bacterium]